LARCRSGGRIPPVGEITEKTEEDSRSNRRPIELIGSPACQRSRSRTAGRPSNKCDVAVSCPHSTSELGLECCVDQLNPPPKAALGRLEIQLPLYPRKQTRLGNRGMSEKCQSRRFDCVPPTSALPPSTDIVRSARQARFVPITEVDFSPDHPVGEREKHRCGRSLGSPHGVAPGGGPRVPALHEPKKRVSPHGVE
jgi:hypothetical protein